MNNNQNEEKVILIINGDESNPVEFSKKLYDDCIKTANKMGITFDDFLAEAASDLIESYNMVFEKK